MNPAGQSGGAVTQLAAELAPDATILQKLECYYNYSALAVAKDLAEGKHSEASAAYYLLRLRSLRSDEAADQTTALVTRSRRPESGLCERSGRNDNTLARHSRRIVHQCAGVTMGKENVGAVETPTKQVGMSRCEPAPPTGATCLHGQRAGDTPGKKLTRSPKPLTLLQTYAERVSSTGEPLDSRRSSPGLFKANNHHPAGAAHAAARAHRHEDAASTSVRERVVEDRSAVRGSGQLSSRIQREGRPSSARGLRAQWAARPAIVPAPPAGAPHRPPSRLISPRSARQPATREHPPSLGAPGIVAKRGAEFRHRKYAQPAQGRVLTLVSAR